MQKNTIGALYKNITSGTVTTLIEKGGVSNSDIYKIIISSSTSTDAGNTKYYFIKDVDIPVGATLVLDDNLGFNKTTYNLRITTQNASDGGTPSLTVIIK